MLLVTTALTEGWDVQDAPLLLLGQWCKVYTDPIDWNIIEHEVLAYHWDDRNKLYNDYTYLEAIYEQQLNALSNQLNIIHGFNNSIRYWRIIIGPWLRCFIEVLFDRYASVNMAIASNKVTATNIISFSEQEVVASSTNQFLSYIVDDFWNHYIYGEIIKAIAPFAYTVIKSKIRVASKQNAFYPKNFKHFIIKVLGMYSKCIPSIFKKHIFINSYLTLRHYLIFNLLLKQLPCYYSSQMELLPKLERHNYIENCKIKVQDEFTSILQNLIPKQIPLVFIEGFKSLRLRALKYYPKKTKSIYSANTTSDIDLSIWIAEQTEAGSKLMCAQHGGTEGSAKWHQVENHNIAISDKYYSWGWHKKGSKIAVRSAGKLLKFHNTLHAKKNGKFLWALMDLPRYSYIMYSVPVAGQVLTYIEQQISMFNLLSPAVKSRLSMRLSPGVDYGWCVKERLQDAGCTPYLADNQEPFYTALQQSALCIATYNATTFLETMAANLPTIIFWNQEHWELRSEAQPYFAQLAAVGILHYSPESIAKTLNAIGNDPSLWWQQAAIQRVRKDFCKRFAYVDHAWRTEWKDELATWRV